MTVIAYAGGAASPKTNQVDALIAQANLNTNLSQTLFGEGEDTENAGANFTFSWTLLAKPPGSSASLSSNTNANASLDSIDTWGNYLCFLIVTNSSTGETSEDDPLRAPNSAFVVVRVQSTQLNLEKPAGGERDWNSRAWAWVEGIEDHEGRIGNLETGATTLTVSDSTASVPVDLASQELEFVSSDNTANVSVVAANPPRVDIGISPTLTLNTLSLNNNLTLNDDNTVTSTDIIFKDGSQNTPRIVYDQTDSTFKLRRTAQDAEIIVATDTASVTDYGLAKLETGATLNNAARILDVERFVFTGAVDGMVRYANATQHHKTADGNVEIENFDNTSVAQHAALLFHNNTGKELDITAVSIIMASAGISTTTDYEFRLVTYSSVADLASNTTQSTTPLGAFNRIGDNQPGMTIYKASDAGNSTITVPNEHVFGILVAQEPDDYPGNRLQCTITAQREIT